MEVDDFMDSVEVAARTTFITARAASPKHDSAAQAVVILAFGGPGDRSGPEREYYLGGTQVAFDAIETIRRQLSIEAGPHGIRFVTLSSGGIPETLPSEFDGRDSIVELIEGQALLPRAATLEEVGRAAVFAASDYAREHDRGDAERQRRRPDRLASTRAGGRSPSAAPRRCPRRW